MHNETERYRDTTERQRILIKVQEKVLNCTSRHCLGGEPES